MDPVIKTFKADLEDMPLSDASKKRISNEFKLAVIRELAGHDEALQGIIVFDGINGGKLIQAAAALRNMSIDQVLKLGG